MCNDAIAIAVKMKPQSRFSLQELVYPRLKEYGLHSHYISAACEVAYSLYRNKKRRSPPYIRKPFLKLDSETYLLNRLVLRIPTTPRTFLFLTLQTSNYHLGFLEDTSLKRGSVTITDQAVIIAFSKEVRLVEPHGDMGIDLNERNVTISTTELLERQFQELGDVVDIKERYRDARSRISSITRGDRRIGRALLEKYGKRERDRTSQRIHMFTKEIVSHAAEHQLQIKMEKLTGIRKLYQKGNGQGPSFRGRMNSWVFGETQRQIGYKAKWVGVLTFLVNPRGTSRNCPHCGSRVVQLPVRKLYCAVCDTEWDRDILASRNIMACAVPQVRPPKGSCEGERGGDGTNPQSGWEEVRRQLRRPNRTLYTTRKNN